MNLIHPLALNYKYSFNRCLLLINSLQFCDAGFAINTIAYMNCFPDCVTDGVPKNIFEKSVDIETQTRSVTFELSEKIRDINHSSISKIPHFRKGHFRVLKSDYFANKKGEIIFVAETMVKGKAKTVSTSPEIDEFGTDTAD